MLTRKEAGKLIGKITKIEGLVSIVSEKYVRDFYPYLHDLAMSIEALTEKPEREIEVGDIYKNRDGYSVSVVHHFLHRCNKEGCIEVNVIENGEKYYVFHNGTDANPSYTPGLSLDLSKRYKIVEDTDD